MSVKFDHLVHFTNQPELVKESFKELGFQAITGGKHPNWGTYNALCYFEGLRYLEWIGFSDMKVAKLSDNILIQQVLEDSQVDEGFSQVAFRTNDIVGLADRLKKQGLDVVGPVPGSRKKEDGSVLNWSMLFINEEQPLGLRAPFFIQWGKNDEAREIEMKELFTHSEQTSTISYVGYVVHDIEKAIEKYSSILGIPSDSTNKYEDEFGEYKEFHMTGFTIRFYQPTTSELIALLNNKGERPFLSGISSVSKEKTVLMAGGYYRLE
ncbi:VOC family protein [Bacillus pinisoli]|uniref:VOC family protein n=1 Tax=Bacillus pinisoli TaxID=2901866 RepID=UPI001FF23C9A|nr:VOC family protein [Bacillus pinisoli]